MVRSGTVSPEAVAKVDAYIAKAREGAYLAQPAILVVTSDYSGFRHSATLEEAGRIIFLESQSIVQGSGGVLVMSLAHDKDTADRNLTAYLAATTIRRIE